MFSGSVFNIYQSVNGESFLRIFSATVNNLILTLSATDSNGYIGDVLLCINNYEDVIRLNERFIVSTWHLQMHLYCVCVTLETCMRRRVDKFSQVPR